MTRVGGRIHTCRALALTTSVALLLAGCGGGEGGGTDTDAAGPGSFADMDPVTLKVATLYGPDNWQTLPVAAYTDAVTEASEGKIEFEYFYGAALLEPAAIAEGLDAGLADLAYFVPVYTPAVFPIDSWVSSLSFVSDPSPIAGSLQGMASVIEWAMNDEEYMLEFEEAGIFPLVPRIQVIHKYSLLCTDPVTTLDQASGKRIRTGGPAWAAEAENLGGIPVQVAGAENYTAFQRGIYDCHMGGPEDHYGLKLTDIGKNFTDLDLTGFTSYVLGMSADKWESLPLAAQQVMWDEIPTYLTAFMGSNFEQNCNFLEAAETAGVEIHEPAAEMVQQVEQHHEKVLAGAAETAPPGVSDPEALVDSFVEAHERWLAKVEELGYSSGAASWDELAADQPCAEAIDIDMEAWVEELQQEVFEPNRPAE